MFNGSAIGGGLFEHEVNGYKGAVVSRIVHDFYELDEKRWRRRRRRDRLPASTCRRWRSRCEGLPPTAPTWGSDYKKLLREWYTRSVYAFGHTTQLPVPTNAVSLDPTVKDAWGLPAIRLTFTPTSRTTASSTAFFAERVGELLDAAGATSPLDGPNGRRDVSRVPSARHVPHGRPIRAIGVVDKYHRAHDVPNLFIVDGSASSRAGAASRR